ncbi:DUF3180 domain-containing protein [Trueperella sp. LYQ143]|uniref:DUF3180 domain-containing protein n=1 Tax=Trueperella sp. LYQ143 TaxID=3391059 RepID=UPI003983C86A
MRKQLAPTSILMLIAVGVVSAVSVAVLVHLFVSRGNTVYAIPVYAVGIPLCIAVVTLWQAWLVRGYVAGKRNINPLHAARIWILTQAVSRVGSILAGGSLGVAVGYFLSGPTSFLRVNARHAVIAGIGAFVMAVAGVVAERWCISDDSAGLSSPGEVS